ncbi:hypothetical protein [Brevibacillus sp. HD3.3A]|uniref:hypothetical protein n=1 Tax=Brevibacillus sp. HD3.3A TaxID=2738979 RepID=UPI00156B757D|nr:hypothetical protein [Brevibacillus sp. HD3.3A]UED72139.1 hypothetical protein HP435_28960 [Brevibacillus sp. HD3.3A]
MITQTEEEALITQAKVNAMAYRQPIIDRLDRQTEKGIRKYGDTIDKAGHLKNGTERLEYLAEELIDALVYIEDIKANGAGMEQLIQELSSEWAAYKEALETIRKILLDTLHMNNPVAMVRWSTITVADPMKVVELTRYVTDWYEKDRDRLAELLMEKNEA